MSDVFSLISTVVALGFKLNAAIDKIRGNKETHQTLVHRINRSLGVLQEEYKKVSGRTSPSLLRSIKKLKTDMECALDACNSPGIRPKLSSLRHWLNKDTIEAVLNTVEKQINACFQEFIALTTLRIERKLNDHNHEVNDKLSELLRRTPKGRVNTPSPVPQRRVIHKKPKSTPMVNRPRAFPGVAKSDISTISSVSSVTSIPKSHSSDRVHLPRPIPVQVQLPRPKIRTASSVSSTSTHSNSSTTPSRPPQKTIHQQADDLDSEFRRLRSLNFPSEALMAARKGVALRRVAHSMNRNANTNAALAKSLSYVGRSMKDFAAGGLRATHQDTELISVWMECVKLYKEAFREDSRFRAELATAAFNLSVHCSEMWMKREASQSANGLNKPLFTAPHRRGPGDTTLAVALDAANEAVHHFEALENDDPETYGIELANALLNLSFVLSDLGRYPRALSTARRAVALSYQFVAILDEGLRDGFNASQIEERIKRVRILHKALMRVSYCLDYLGRREESKEVALEASRVNQNQSAAMLGI